MKNLSALMKQASEMQSRVQEMQTRLETLEIVGEAGGGMVHVTLSGKGDLKRVKIDPKLADPGEMDMLEDLLVAAHAQARGRMEAIAKEEMNRITGGLPLPPGLKLPF